MTVEYTIDKSRLAQDTGMIASGAARIGCLVALAHRFEDLLRSGVVKDYAELARLGHVTRARVTQIMNLLSLVPEIQEYLLFLPAAPGQRVTERDLRRVAAEVRWDRQRAMFGSLSDLRTGSHFTPDFELPSNLLSALVHAPQAARPVANTLESDPRSVIANSQEPDPTVE